MKKMRIDLYSHSFKVSRFKQDTKVLIKKFIIKYGQIGLIRKRGRYTRGVVRVYGASNKRRTLYRMHRNTLEDFLEFLMFNGIPKSSINIVNHKPAKSKSLDLEYIDTRTPRDYQDSICKYLVAPGNTKLVTLDPGKGKTYICLRAMSQLNELTFFSLKSSYIDKWIKDIEEAFTVPKGTVMVIRGSKNLRRLLELGVTGELEAKIILCSSSTLREYYKTYEMYENNMLNMGFACTPIKMWDALGVGLRVVDENHETLHFNYKLDLYTNVKKTIALSGTMFSDDPFITMIQETMFPLDIRCETIKRDKYVDAYRVEYSIENANRRVQCINRALDSYSHVLFENSIMKDPDLLKSYVNFIADMVEKTFMKDYEEGQKAIVYCSTIDLCTIVATKLKEKYEDLIVGRYVGEDSYDDMLDFELIVTTLKSLGTAIDIPDLKTILMTDSLMSRQLNVQVLGRIRPLKRWPDVTPEFYYFTCVDIDRQVKYGEKKEELFAHYVKTHSVLETDVVL